MLSQQQPLILCGPLQGAALSVTPRPSVRRPTHASDFLEIGKPYTSNLVET